MLKKILKIIDEFMPLFLWLLMLLSLLKFEPLYAILIAILILNENVERKIK